MGAVLPALRLEHVIVIRITFAEQLFQRADLGQVGDRHLGVGVGKPDAVAQAKAGMAIEGDAELARQQFALDEVAHGLAFQLHRRV